nr:SdrD B-like domain-containing protein [Staphylococcus simulans]
MITNVDATNTTNDFTEVVYVNPTDLNLSSAALVMAPKDGNSNALIGFDYTTFHIYEVPDPSQLPDSYDFEAAGYQDLAQSFQNNGSIYTNANGDMIINFGAIDNPYVVVMDSQFDPTYSSNLTTRATLYATDQSGYTASYFFDNSFVIENSSGTGDGTLETYRLGDYVWEDSNKDGIQNSNEVGIEGVTVTLTKPDGSTVTTVTDANGKYEFTGLEKGDYTVDFTAPEGYEPTAVNVGDDALDSDGASTTVTINNADNYTIDSGFFKPAVEEPTPVPATYNLGDYVWEDSNKDGIQNSNEVGIEGVTVTLTKPDGSTVTTVTDANGKYEFTGLENGDYTVDFATPEGYEPTAVNVGDDALDSDGASTTVTINNADNYTIDSGFFKPAVEEPTPVPATYNLGDYVWEDTNKDGVQNSNEPGIPGVEVTLTKPDGSTVTTTTDNNGNYEFTNLPNGDYTITFETPEGYEPTTPNVGNPELDSNGTTTTVTVNNGDDKTIDSGFYKPVQETPQEPATYTVGDKVWEDTNKDGVQNSNEPGIPGVEVTLTKPDGSTVTTTTDNNGNYEFTNLPNGDYTITFETPEGYEPTTPNVGNPELDSNGTTTTVTVNNGDDKTIDSGFYKPTVEPTPVPATYNLGDYVWEDSNKDGIQNSNEVGIEGVTVTLTKPDGSVVTTTTDANGKYEFTDLPNGEYTITFEAPEGYEPTLVNVGNTALDSDRTTTTVTINNADNYTIDSGFFKPVVEPTPVPATYTVGDKVWEDTNKDGIQNSNEPGIPGVEVTLTKPDGSTVTTTTDENGNYEFTNLPNGEYTITFETPEGYEPTLVNVGNTALDSDGKTVTVIVNNADDKTIDSGFYKPVVEPTPEDPTPEEPGTPEKPEEPTTPEEPGTPEKPEEPTTPEEPGTPEKPEEPTTPEEPGTPEKPEVPTTPEESGTPEKPEVPTTPEEPGTPEKPEVPTTPEEPGTPEKPEVPTTPEEPGTPEKPEVPTTPEEPTAPAVTPAPSVEQPAVEKQEKPSEEASSKEKEEALPDTGETESTNNATLFGGLFAALGSILLFGRRRKDNKDKQ